MMFDSDLAISLTQKLIAFAIFFQSLELLILRKSFSDKGVWRFETLKPEFEIFSKLSSELLSFFLKYQNFVILLIVRVLFSISLFMYSSSIGLFILLVTTILISLRWRGTFNGGSDYVTVLVLMSLLVCSVFKSSQQVSNACLWYIAIQITSSYFIAGVIKLKKRNWRNGSALRGFLLSTIYNENRITKFLIDSHALLLFFSWLIILFEVSFVLVFLNQYLCLIYLAFAFCFHLANFYFFGLNRFIFAWISGYPALLFCVGLLG